MKEIKFRAWDGCRMFSNDEIYIYDGYPCHKNEYDHVGVKNGKLMQFTGVYSTSGEEIYEGDLIKEPFGAIKPVVWEPGGFIIGSNQMNKDLWFGQFKVEVIGNIYENPENVTLKEEKDKQIATLNAELEIAKGDAACAYTVVGHIQKSCADLRTENSVLREQNNAMNESLVKLRPEVKRLRGVLEVTLRCCEEGRVLHAARILRAALNQTKEAEDE